MTLEEIDAIRQPLSHIRMAGSNLRVTLNQVGVMTETMSQLLDMIERNVVRIDEFLVAEQSKPRQE